MPGIGKGEVQGLVYLGKLLTVSRNSADKQLLMSALFSEAALVLPPGLEQGITQRWKQPGKGEELRS